MPTTSHDSPRPQLTGWGALSASAAAKAMLLHILSKRMESWTLEFQSPTHVVVARVPNTSLRGPNRPSTSSAAFRKGSCSAELAGPNTKAWKSPRRWSFGAEPPSARALQAQSTRQASKRALQHSLQPGYTIKSINSEPCYAAQSPTCTVTMWH